jgi:hypothetical protein
VSHANAPRNFVVAALLAACLPALGAEQPGFAAHRYDEDWRSFCAATAAPAGIDRLKCLALPGEALLSLGGEWRERFEAVDAPRLGLSGDRDSLLLHRLLLHADIRAGKDLRLFLQLGSHHQNGRRGGPSPTDEDRLDLQQGFVDLASRLAGGDAYLRLGRQEFTLGSSRLLSSRESPNVRRAYDGLSLRWQTAETQVDAFRLTPLRIGRSRFDDEADTDERLWGLQLSRRSRLLPQGRAELYYLGAQREDAGFAAGIARERRHSLGVRLFGAGEAVDWNVEVIAQAGDFGDDEIRAWTFASDSGYRYTAFAWQPRLGLKADIASGDGDPDDGRLETFSALYPTPTYFSEASLVAPANFIDLQPSLTLRPSPSTSLLIGWQLLWKQRRADAIYVTPTPATPLAGSTGGPSFIGQQLRIEPTWSVTPRLQLRAAYVHFFAGAALRRADGDDVDFAMLSASYRF